jgi:SET domain-containing protein
VKRLLHENARVKRGAHGLGLFAAGPVKKGAVVAEYWGPVVTGAEMKRSRGKYFFELDSGMAIDGKGRKNAGRYINHACVPNCEPMEDEKQQRIFILAKRNIKAGEEFGYDYGQEYWDTYIKPIGCRCGCGGKGPREAVATPQVHRANDRF